MKKLLLMVAAVGMLFTACCNKDNSKALVGTWTNISEDGIVETMVIKEDGSFAITGTMKGGYLYEEKGSIKTVNNKVTLAYDGGDVFDGRIELEAGKTMSIVLNEEYDIRLTYDYCNNDLNDEIVGMWACDKASADAQDMIQTFYEDGKCVLAGCLHQNCGSKQVNKEATDYKVIGDLLFVSHPTEKVDGEEAKYVVGKLTYTPNEAAEGDVLTIKTYREVEGQIVEKVLSFHRIK